MFKRENRYLVIKYKDLEKLPTSMLNELEYIVDTVNYSRGLKGPLKCVVVESDWPEYESTWQTIETRMKESQ